MNVSRALMFVIVCAVVVRLASLGFVLAFGSGEVILSYGDGIVYTELATSIANNQGFTIVNNAGERVLETFRTPGLPFLLAFFMPIPHGIAAWAFVLAIAAGILLPFLTYRIGEMLFDQRIGMITAVLTAFEPHLVWFSWLALSEMPFILFFLGGTWLLLSRWEQGHRVWPLLSGALLGYAVLIRPSYLLIFAVVLMIAVGWYFSRRQVVNVKRLLFIVLGITIALLPWSIRNYVQTGSAAISGMGWYNVYFDYMAAVLAIERGVDSQVVKNELKERPPEGVLRGEVGNPIYAPILRDVALRELAARPVGVLKLETMLAVTFFTNDSYYYYLRRFGFLDESGGASGSRSATLAVLSRGADAISHLIAEMHRQRYIPLVGRAFTTGVFLLAVVGVWAYRHRPAVWMIFILIALTALTSSALGMGLEARLRVPVQPFLFMLAVAGVYQLLLWYRNRTHTTGIATVHTGT